MRKTKGFTLAEVLITLGIIGVVAAMTTPTLITNYQKHKVATRLKHTYSTLAQVFRMAEGDYGEISGWDLTHIYGDVTKKKDDPLYAFIYTYMIPYMTGITVSKKQMTYKEFGYKKGIYDPYTKKYDNLTGYFIRMNNGVLLQPRLTTGYNSGTNTIMSIAIYVDIDGTSGFNTWGKDVFGLAIIPSTGKLEMAGETLTFNSKTGLPSSRATSRAELLKYCKTTSANYCGALIKWDSWTIMNDYPWL